MAGLERLLRPQSIAVIGGGAWGESVVAQCRKIGFAGDVWPVHPKKNEVSGVKAFNSLADLPGAPDAAFVGVNRNMTIAVVRALSAMGAGGAICFASGFLEALKEDANGAGLQDELLAGAGDMKIIGPNCYGFVNYLDGAALWPDQHGGERVSRGVALVTQSSNIAINLTMQRRGLPLAYVVTAGNQAQTDLSEIGIALLEDPRVSALGLHIEGIGNLRNFEALASRARKLGKPVVALKVGKSDHAQTATISHTASLAGSDAGARALLLRLGIGQVSSLSSLLETLKLLHVVGPLASGRIASMSCSGGEASLMADAAHGSGLVFPLLDDGQQTGLRDALGAMVALANPLDYHTYIWGDEDALTATFSAMMAPSLAFGCIVLDFPRSDRCQSDDWDKVINAACATRDATGVPLAIVGSLGENMPEDVAKQLVGLGLVPFCGISEAIEAMDVAARLGKDSKENIEPQPLLLPKTPHSIQTLSEAQAKTDLAFHGLRVPRAETAASPLEAGKAAQGLGLPVVLKGQGIAHKTEAGAVVLNLSSKAEVEAAAQAMGCDRFLVEEMVTGTIAEMLVGVVRDPAHGYVLTLAAGGTLTELLADSASLLLPATKQSVRAALESLKVAGILNGYRGGPAANIDAIVAAVMVVQDYVTATRVEEVEINPLMCGRDVVVAADALVKAGDSND